MDLYAYWEAVLKQQAAALGDFFHKDAFINWHNTNERFTVEGFIRANCEYPGEWDGEIERIEQADNLWITVTHVYSSDQKHSFHVTSFIKVDHEKIASIDEYWGDDGLAPEWRAEKNISIPIR